MSVHNKSIFIMDENEVKNEKPKVLLTKGEDDKLKATAGKQDCKLKRSIPRKRAPTSL
jgi:hypothetical protein